MALTNKERTNATGWRLLPDIESNR